MNVDHWDRVSSRWLADCRVFKVRGDLKVRVSADVRHAGHEAEFFVVHSPDFANVVALTGQGNVVLVEQYRHGVERMSVEVPAGLIDDGERPEDACRRELLEETGYEADTWIQLADIDANPAIMSNRNFCYLAIGARKVAEPAFDDHEHIRSWEAPLAEALAMIGDGRIRHPYAIIALHLAAAHPDVRGDPA